MAGDNAPKPNKQGVTITFFDRFDDWEWGGQDADICARAARTIVEEIAEDGGITLFERKDGISIVMMALDGDLALEADLLDLVRHLAEMNDIESDRVIMRRVLTEALALLDGGRP
jgi:hypothetical protein